ncbi:MAG: 5-(carboxyamino)imidazole ribonucleotide synthase [Gammaproteobacteria bacterium]|nr:5-(carboxyamino)imidazole ribonucleotide synthase [Gammaproteobacteria bacterium]
MTKQILPKILPGATLGVLGGGQLGRMFCVAARTLGYRVVVLEPDEGSPAGRIADEHIKADYLDKAALDLLASRCDAVTTEFENVPAESLRYLAKSTQVSPSADALEIAQNRHYEKQYALKAGLNPAPYYFIQSDADIEKAIETIGVPAILKSATLGYDGKGQAVINSAEELISAFASMKKVACVLEKKIDLALEVSVIVARNTQAEAVSYPIAENQHRDGILHLSAVPARIEESLANQARQQALALAESMDYVGILAVEFFISGDGELIFNEMAPRPHNSGHYTKDACVTSQFEQQARMMCGLKPGDTRLTSPVVMVNMLGDLWEPDWAALLAHPEIKLHLYGKTEARPGRKMGHFNVLGSDVEQALAVAELAFDELQR